MLFGVTFFVLTSRPGSAQEAWPSPEGVASREFVAELRIVRSGTGNRQFEVRGRCDVP